MKIPLLFGLLAATQIQAATFFIEAEQFANKGGWGVDTQFIESVGSSYLIAHVTYVRAHLLPMSPAFTRRGSRAERGVIGFIKY